PAPAEREPRPSRARIDLVAVHVDHFDVALYQVRTVRTDADLDRHRHTPSRDLPRRHHNTGEDPDALGQRIVRVERTRSSSASMPSGLAKTTTALVCRNSESVGLSPYPIMKST